MRRARRQIKSAYLEKRRRHYLSYRRYSQEDLMTKLYELTAAAVMFFSTITFAAESPKANPMRPEQVQKLLSPDVPRVLCLDENFATAGNPPEMLTPRPRQAALARC